VWQHRRGGQGQEGPAWRAVAVDTKRDRYIHWFMELIEARKSFGFSAGIYSIVHQRPLLVILLICLYYIYNVPRKVGLCPHLKPSVASDKPGVGIKLHI
jgi:hypothetical protein